jgi:protein-S-isoprenylcysteine O-methyltransferase Ste14
MLGVFAVQHSVMARAAFKRWWTQRIPASVERSTYVLSASLVLLVLFWQWRPLPAICWRLEGAPRFAMQTLYALGWLLVLGSTFLISHTDLFGLRQVMAARAGRGYESPPFVLRGLYRIVRHPLMLGFLVVFWAAPTMSVGHLVFAFASSAYIVAGVLLEERDLVATLGDPYVRYRARVPMLIPGSKRAARDPR